MEKLLTVREAAELLRLGRSTLYNLMDRGLLAYVKIGRARRIPPSEIERLVNASMITPVAQNRATSCSIGD
ncbi:MAG: DNA-binding protein [Planctomycetota bacterium]|mgnify:CR=1 FL=1|nr:MAG: DNA-binding protein [Planctomycetota bacterium]REK20151.1 MAG: DNA-binding protein [Planctomycetota bacterium]REK32127.1 MAG: DNA-binding protein [Planctomycetota bacterium]